MLRLALLVLVALPARAYADDEPVDSYGYQVALADTAPLLILSTALVLPDGPFLELSAGAYLVGGPIVHVAHARYGHAAASLGVRIGFPIIGLFVGDLMHQAFNAGDPHVWEEFDGPPSPWWVLGGAAGFVAACAVDATVIAKGDRPRGTQWAPIARANRDGVAIGVAAAF